MAFNSRHRAHFWLFQAGLDPDEVDATGLTRAESLARLLVEASTAGRREAATRFLSPSIPPQVVRENALSTDAAEETTGRYDLGQLEAAIVATTKRP